MGLVCPASGGNVVEAPAGSRFDGGRRRWPGVEVSLFATIASWVVVTLTLTVMLLLRVRQTHDFGLARAVLHVAYVAALVWTLVRRGPALRAVPASPLGARAGQGRWKAATAVAALVLGLAGLAEAGLLLLLLAAVTAGFTVGWRRQWTWRAAALGLAVTLLAFGAGGFPFWRHGFVRPPILVFMLVAVPPMFVVGALLVVRSGIGAVHLAERRYGDALRGFCWGAALFVPLGLVNAAGSVRPGLNWVTHWWQPLVLPLWSGVTEEVVFRLVLVPLGFALLRPALTRSATLAAVLAVLFSAASFGLAHGRSVEMLLATGLGYGLPLAVIFARRSWEHAVGAHYMINMIPTAMALAENTWWSGS